MAATCSGTWPEVLPAWAWSATRVKSTTFRAIEYQESDPEMDNEYPRQEQLRLTHLVPQARCHST